MRRYGVAATVALLAACARALPPPGGEEDRFPPQVIATEPEPLAIVPDFAGPVVFRFDERLTERNVDRSVLVSPATGEVRAEHRGSAIRVRIEGGWQPGLVYRVVLLPGVGDLFGNQRQVPAELVFSTGPEIPETALAGIVLDRITMRPARNVIVEATPVGDSTAYRTTADSVAFFALGHLPVGAYEVTAYVDQNENRQRDLQESFAAPQEVTFAGPQDTIPLVLAVIPPDTTPAQVTRAQARDSMEVRVTIDDYLDPDIPLGARATLFALPDTAPWAGVHHVMSPDSFDVMQRALRAAAGEEPEPDTARAEPPAEEPEAEPPDEPLPFREIVFVPGSPLPPERQFLLRIEGLTNIAGITGGGGDVEFETPARLAPRDTTAADTGRVRVDTTSVGRRR